jgi:glycosyltransferase involved in cell wall biosynthesis
VNALRPKTIVVLPAYNAAETLQRTLADLPLTHVDELILVDDASKDATAVLAEEAAKGSEIPFSVVRLAKNRGYGGNQKECYKAALERGAEIIVMVHPDYQYDPHLVKHLVDFIAEGYFDVMLGSRIRSRQEALAGGMPFYKYVANRALTFIENLASGRNLGEWHTGMRAYNAKVLRALPLESYSDDFVFDQQVLWGIVEHGYSMGDIPVPVRYFEEASSINLKRSTTYGLLTLREVARHLLKKLWRRVTR